MSQPHPEHHPDTLLLQAHFPRKTLIHEQNKSRAVVILSRQRGYLLFAFDSSLSATFLTKELALFMARKGLSDTIIR
jgi:hypothetical protein